jgi:uncharacterized protein (TIGR02588 family)
MARHPPKRDSVPPIEWVAGISSLILVLGTLAFLAFEALQSRAPLPDLRLAVESVSPTTVGHSVTVVVRNVSQQAAADVVIEGRATGGEQARAEARLDYVAALSERRAVLVFPFPPDMDRLELRVLGYTTP